MAVTDIDHVQLAMPADQEPAAVAFYEGLLGLPQVPKPDALAGRGGCWFERGDVRVHLGVEAPFRPARKAHPAFVVDDLGALLGAIAAAGHEVVDAPPLPGQRRAHVFDPFGNRIELIEHLAA
ncbi:MAG: VOC family protein [Acidimicrobiia bacterium]|jgi:catechol 2,3-dioxygenase-like lactoylglutathione lyase family enzyme